MTVSRSQRTYPLVLKSVSMNTGIISAYDWAAEDGSTTADNGKDHSGNAHHWDPVGTSASIVTDAVGKGRDPSAGQTVSNRFYSATSAATLGMDRGTGDWTMFWRIRSPSTAPATTTLRQFARICDGAGEKISLYMYEIVGTGWKVHLIANNATVVLDWSTTGNPAFTANSDVTIHMSYSGGSLKAYVNGVLLKTTSVSMNLLSTTGSSNVAGNFGHTMDFILHDTIFWNRQLSDAEVTAQAANPYSYYNNSAPADSITVTSPANNATVGVNIAISGTYAGGDNPAGIEASFNGGAYQTIVASPSGGVFSGTLTGQAVGTGTLTVRWTDQTSVSTTVTNLTVSNASIAFTTPSTQQSVKAYRLFQRNSSNQATVRVSGTYTGTPTTIEYQWAGGAWTTLIASPSGGVYDTTITLQGLKQGTFSVRHSNNTGVIASVPYVAVGDLYIVGGQSNNVGMAGNYISPTSPSANPSWISLMFGKDGTWKQHLDDSLHVFDDRTGATYSVQTNATTPGGSYFGALATKIMQAGIPVAFVPCALGSSSITDWAVSTSTTTLYGAMLARANELGSHKAVIWWQGEQEAVAGGYTQAQYATALGTLVDDWFTRTGSKWILQAINSAGTGSNYQNVHDAIIQVGQTNAHVLCYADQNGAFGQLHYNTGAELLEVANRTFTAITNVGATNISGTIGNAVAAGLTALVANGMPPINTTVGNAIAAGLTAAVVQATNINASIGNANANGITSSISVATVVNASTGNVVASGQVANVTYPITINATTANVVCQGKDATVTIINISYIKKSDILIATLTNGISL